jgi:hypothetical protein
VWLTTPVSLQRSHGSTAAGAQGAAISRAILLLFIVPQLSATHATHASMVSRRMSAQTRPIASTLSRASMLR